jgi:hypothetical protein
MPSAKSKVSAYLLVTHLFTSFLCLSLSASGYVQEGSLQHQFLVRAEVCMFPVRNRLEILIRKQAQVCVVLAILKVTHNI